MKPAPTASTCATIALGRVLEVDLQDIARLWCAGVSLYFSGQATPCRWGNVRALAVLPPGVAVMQSSAFKFHCSALGNRWRVRARCAPHSAKMCSSDGQPNPTKGAVFQRVAYFLGRAPIKLLVDRGVAGLAVGREARLPLASPSDSPSPGVGLIELGLQATPARPRAKHI